MAERAALEMAFKAFDTDKSGLLTVDEVKAILTRGEGGMPDSEVQALIAQFDTNSDGKLSINEVPACPAAQRARRCLLTGMCRSLPVHQSNGRG